MAPMSSDLPLGFRFAPTDEEKLLCLEYKNRGLAEKHNVIIPELDICKCEPRDLAQKNLLTGRDGDLYFFSQRKRKYPNSTIIERTTGEGYWKDAGKDQDIKTSDERLIGTRKSLLFYKGSPRHSSPTEWRMKEYILGRKGSSASLQDAYGLYRVFKSNRIGEDANESTLNPKVDHNEYSSTKPLEVLLGEQTLPGHNNESSSPPLEVAAEVLFGEQTHSSQEINYPQLDIPSFISGGSFWRTNSFISGDHMNDPNYPQEINYPYHSYDLPGHNNESSCPVPLDVADYHANDSNGQLFLQEMCRLPMWETEKFYFP